MQLYWVSTITYVLVLGIILYSDIRTTKQPRELEKSFRSLANWVIIFCVQDTLWGLCQARIIKNDIVFFISSSVFHMATVITTYFWLKYVLEYLGNIVKNKKLYLALDIVVICAELFLVILNFFKTTLFSIVDGNYITGPYRPITFINQYAVYLIIGVITLVFTLKKGTKEIPHYRIVFIFTLAPILLGIFQLMFPDAPFYSLGYFLGCFIIYIFIVSSDREVYLSKEEKLRKIIELNDVLEKKQVEIDDQFDILKSISSMFDYINLLDFEFNTAYRFDIKDSIADRFDILNDPHTQLNKKIAPLIAETDYERFWQYTNLSTLDERMKGKKLISSEFKYVDGDWIRVFYIRIGDDTREPIGRVAYALRNITSDRKREEQIYSAMTNVFYSLHIIDLEKDRLERLIESDIFKKISGNEKSAQSVANTIIRSTCKTEFLDSMLEFVDLSTVSSRIKGKKALSREFVGKYHGWTRMTFIPIEFKNNRVKKMVIITQIIDSEKNEVLNLMYKSSTDELTRLYNRRTYAEDIEAIVENKDMRNLVIVAMDVNGLKTANDTLGHKAGDELIIGASSCIEKAFSLLGKVYRTGGDEFVAILRCDAKELSDALNRFEESMNTWSGQLVDKLSISYGYAGSSDYPELTIKDLVSEADKRMYAAKSEYYINNGINRRRT